MNLNALWESHRCSSLLILNLNLFFLLLLHFLKCVRHATFCMHCFLVFDFLIYNSNVFLMKMNVLENSFVLKKIKENIFGLLFERSFDICFINFIFYLSLYQVILVPYSLIEFKR